MNSNNTIVDDRPMESIDKYTVYQQYEEQFRMKATAYQVAYAAALADPDKLAAWPAKGIRYKEDLDIALREWETMGYKSEVDALLQVIDMELNMEGIHTN